MTNYALIRILDAYTKEVAVELCLSPLAKPDIVKGVRIDHYVRVVPTLTVAVQRLPGVPVGEVNAATVHPLPIAFAGGIVETQPGSMAVGADRL